MHGFKQNSKMNSSINCYKTGGSVKKSKPAKKADGGKVKPIVKKAIKQHDKNMHGGKTETIKLKKGGAMKADGGSMSASTKKPAKASMKKPMAKKPKAPAKPAVPPLGSPQAMEPMPTPAMGAGMSPAPMMSHGGTVRHEHYAMGGAVSDQERAAMAGGMAGAGLGGGLGAMADPRLMQAKRRLGGIGAGAGVAPAVGGGVQGGMAPPAGVR